MRADMRFFLPEDLFRFGSCEVSFPCRVVSCEFFFPFSTLRGDLFRFGTALNLNRTRSFVRPFVAVCFYCVLALLSTRGRAGARSRLVGECYRCFDFLVPPRRFSWQETSGSWFPPFRFVLYFCFCVCCSIGERRAGGLSPGGGGLVTHFLWMRRGRRLCS